MSAKEEGRPSRWKDGLTRSFAHCNRPHIQCLMPWEISSSNGTETGKVEASGSRHPGAMGSRCEATLLRGTSERCRGESTGLTLFIVAPDELLTNGWKLLEQGPESQSASAICAGGVSAVMSSSELDSHTLHPLQGSCHRSNDALPSMAKPPIVGMVCPSSDAWHN